MMLKLAPLARQVSGKPAARSVIIPMLQYRKTGLETLPEVHRDRRSGNNDSIGCAV